MTLPEREGGRSREGAQVVQQPVRRPPLDVTRELELWPMTVEHGANDAKVLNRFNRRSDGGRRAWKA